MRSNKKEQYLLEHRIKDSQGFTLVETIIALLLGMIISLGTASLFFYAVKYNSAAEERARAMAVAQEEIERLRALTFAQLDDATLTLEGDPRNVTVADHIYTIDIDISAGTLRTVRVIVTPQAERGIMWAAKPVELITLRSEPES
jgi:Tfp pilus assembly protein PilV